MKVIDNVILEMRAFNRFYTNMLGLLDNHLLKSKYSLVEARILYEIDIGKNIRASDIMNAMDIDKSYLSRLLKKMEKDNLIARKPSQNDARATYIHLTRLGTEVFQSLNLASNQQIKELLSPLKPEKQTELINHMNAIIKLLKLE